MRLEKTIDVIETNEHANRAQRVMKPLFNLDFVRELRFATSVEGTWWEAFGFERDLTAIWSRDEKQFEESKNDEH